MQIENKGKKGFVSVLLILVILFTSFFCAAEESFAASAPTSKAQVEKQLKETEKQIKELEKKNKAQWSGKSLLTGAIVQTSPLIVQPLGTNSYYYVKDTKNLISGFPVYGAVKLSDKYQYVNGYYCRVVYAKKIDIKIEDRLNKAKEKRTKLKASLSNKFLFGEKEYFVQIGDKLNLKDDGEMKSDEEKYNKISWSSSDKTIATVSKTGVVTAKKAGTVTITAKASISGKKTSCKVKCYGNLDDIHFEQSEYIYDAKDYDGVWLKLVSENQDVLDSLPVDDWDVTCEYINPYMQEHAKIERYVNCGPSTIRLYLVFLADFKVTLTTDEGQTISCVVKFLNSECNSWTYEPVNEEAEGLDDAYDDY